LLSTAVAWGQAQFDSGFYSATGNAAQTVKDGWLENGCATGEPYLQGYYHNGADFGRAYGLVYAIWDGTVIQISTDGWGTGNVAVIVKSRLDNGQEFLWLLGHVQAGSTPNPGATVTKGTQVALIGHWSLGDHVHVGIFPGTTLPSTDSVRQIGWGRMGCANWADASKFLGSFGVNVGWSPPWELRWGAMSFTNDLSILMYHATNNNDPSQRLVMFWDPDSSAWYRGHQGWPESGSLPRFLEVF
jgi:murein DD-endopeptidase MepM/ murein hydrolase activator NlpD